MISRQPSIFASYSSKQQEFLEFVLDSYIRAGFRELDREKPPILLGMKYGGLRDASSQIGAVSAIKTLFEDFQKYLYEEQEAA
jgi:type I restriction enzyme R subunit